MFTHRRPDRIIFFKIALIVVNGFAAVLTGGFGLFYPGTAAAQSKDDILARSNSERVGGCKQQEPEGVPPFGGGYTYTIGTGSIVPGTVDTGNHTDDGATVIGVPFSFSLYDLGFSNVAVGSNGFLTFGTVASGFNISCLPVPVASYTIAPYWTDQCTGPCTNTTCTGCGIFTSMSGSAPNRIFNIEWRTRYFNSGGSGVPLNYEVRLYEASRIAFERFDVVYGLVNTFNPPSARNLTVGVQRINAANNFTIAGCDSSGGIIPPVSSGQVYHYFRAKPQPRSDFDGDVKTDISVFRPSAGQWYLQESTAGLYGAQFGILTDAITPADYDGDGKTDIAVYRPSSHIWYVLRSSDGTVAYTIFGTAEDLPTPADYDEDGMADVSVFRPSNGTWYRQNSGDGTFFATQFGQSGDKPTIGDFDGDERADLAIFRPSTGAWYRINSSNGSVSGVQFGVSTDKIVHADYDGDGKADISVFRPSNATWYRQNSSDGSFYALQFGASGDKPTQTAFIY